MLRSQCLRLRLCSPSKVVIGGGGVIGCSIAYHLAKQGWTDVVLLEQGKLTCGTTWHAAGLVGRLRGSSGEISIVNYSSQLYKQLDDEGYSTGWKQCGSLNLCRTSDRVVASKRAMLNAKRFGVDAEMLTPEEVQEMVPMLRTDDLKAGVFVPGDGVVNPTDVTRWLRKQRKWRGVKFIEGCKINQVLLEGSKVAGVETDLGHIKCDYFVNCAGQWARDLGQLSSIPVRVPLHSCEHYYLVTKAMDAVSASMPVIRDYDGYVYLREWSGGLLAGGFEPEAKPVFHEGIPEKFEFQLLPEDWDHFQILLDQMLHRVPCLSDAQVRNLTNGPESFTPDGKYILGRAPEVKNYFIAAGMNSSGIAAAGGVGKHMAEWIIRSEPSIDLWMLDVRRFVDLHNNKKFLRDRVRETLGNCLKGGASSQLRSSRRVGASPLHLRMHQRSAVFDQSARGVERAIYFDYLHPHHDDFQDTSIPQKNGSYGKPLWFDKVKAEYWACRAGVGLIDMSTFTKFDLRSAGTEVVDFLQYVCSNDVDKAVGTIIHTGMQNHHGGYENDCSVVRLADNRYFMIGPTAQQTRSYAWLKDHLPQDGSVVLSDVTSMYTAINVIGPKAQELLAELTDAPLGKQDFTHMTCKEINVGQASGIKAMRLTHSGEDGWILYIPSEYALHVYDSLMAYGENYGIRNTGYYALRALRTEKFFAYWGTDLTPQVTPLECGREYRVKLDKGGFIGYAALVAQRQQGIKKKLVQFLIEDHDLDEDVWPWGGEPIFRNGQYCGMTTSTAYGFTLDRHVCLGYVEDIDPVSGKRNILTSDFILKNAKYEVDIAGKRFPCKAGTFRIHHDPT
ncbi:hypothetical protein CAPTEDRAFT_226885 [Capitella teleta]|uniref:Pyruvate dehydrogenase phosphatase regulatory subunit, mitochondrial n=1 Tax=Capitella teleta TaxID=283909 RepID=R7US21_CAPTE|nr:hypothetical protein CAPTEDRAFT_226885 [Capitella teleta]|eukprot:ELU09314.1 hypothetical protein CAPTEDRAFT_226885 [Capitella teleta]